MNSLPGWAFLACLIVCGCGQTEYHLVDPCRGVSCGDLETCDPVDALCKCGPVEQNLLCGADERCTAQGESAFTCVNVRCELVTCAAGETCQPATGTCACGSGASARTCGEDQTCQNGRCSPGPCDGVSCRFGNSCDPETGICGCGGVTCGVDQACVDDSACASVALCELYPPDCRRGEVCRHGDCSCGGGDPCAEGQRCDGGTCVVDRCAGVNCPAGSVCGDDDALCHCDDAAGPVCAAGQACVGGACVASTVCERVTCAPGMVCDPDPRAGQGGFCRCGGVGAGFPRCGADQSCDLSGTAPACRGGDPCRDRDCGQAVPGSSCDPEDGVCRCGGLDGVACTGGGAACAVEDGRSVCTAICDPLVSSCSGEEACVFDAPRGLALCLRPGDGVPDRACREVTDCVAGTFCAQVQDGKVCREICDVATGAGCPEDKFCARLGSETRLGQCIRFQ